MGMAHTLLAITHQALTGIAAARVEREGEERGSEEREERKSGGLAEAGAAVGSQGIFATPRQVE